MADGDNIEIIENTGNTERLMTEVRDKIYAIHGNGILINDGLGGKELIPFTIETGALRLLLRTGKIENRHYSYNDAATLKKITATIRFLASGGVVLGSSVSSEAQEYLRKLFVQGQKDG